MFTLYPIKTFSCFYTALSALLLAMLMAASAASAAESIAILPAEIHLTGAGASQRLIVEELSDQSFVGECRKEVAWKSADENIVKVIDGVAMPQGNGESSITVQVGDQSASVQVIVQNVEQPLEAEFRRHVVPVLSKTGCNTGACHGALAGKGGFRLSLNGYDAVGDHSAITQYARGRRIEFGDPGRSLLLAKPTGALPHKGGLKLDPKSKNYETLVNWISTGAKPPTADDPQLERIEVQPAHALLQPDDSQQLIVRAFYSDGRVEDVTHLAKYTSTEATVAKVEPTGQVTVMGSGEGAIVVWFSSRIVLSRITAPYAHAIESQVFADAPVRNLIDEHVNRKLQQLNLMPSPRSSDEMFLRRIFLDTIGVLPTPEETVAFLDDSEPEKRDHLIESLLEREEFVDYWAYRWGDVLLINGKLLKPKAVKAYYEWIRNHVQKNTPWDEVVSELVTSEGSSLDNGATNFFAIHTSPEDMAENVSQAFLGLSINCAKCHNHPLEKWTNDQYYAMANLFARVRGKGWNRSAGGDGQRTLFVSSTGELVQPRTGRPQLPTPLDGEALDLNDTSDRRDHLAKWLTAPDNPYFTRSIVNRVWHAYLGVGLVESVDDLRVSNPASNEELLTALADFVIEHKYDLKSLMRLILQSETYQRTSQPLDGNAEDRRFYARYYPRRLMAEVLLDAISQVSEVPTTFDKIGLDGGDVQETKEYESGTRAAQLYDSAVQSKFLTMFGRNERDIVCECQRSNQPSMVQVLHINNGETINEKLRDEKSCVSQLLQSETAAEQIIDEAYLRALSRRPTEEERQQLQQVFTKAIENVPEDAEAAAAIRREVLEDLYWSLMSSREFLFQH